MSGPVTRKRARRSSNDDDSVALNSTAQSSTQLSVPACASPRTRDEEFWYGDGSIILLAGDIEFRVYQGLLAENSPVFRDMFSLPQPPVSSISTILLAGASCQATVHLSDSPEDVRHMLRVFMPKNNRSIFTAPEDPSYHTISAAVRLGHKYQMPMLLQQALDYLKNHYTNDLDAWDDYSGYCPPGFDDVHSIGVVNLARLTGETSLLPTALLACCQLEQQLFDGFEREDGTREQLALGDISLCFTARARLIHESTRLALCVLRPKVSDECKTAAGCKRGFLRLMERVEADVSTIVGMDPFQFMIAFEEDVCQEVDLCKPCRAMVDDRNDRERRALWDRLPEILGIAEPDPGGAEEGGEAVGAT